MLIYAFAHLNTPEMSVNCPTAFVPSASLAPMVRALIRREPMTASVLLDTVEIFVRRTPTNALQTPVKTTVYALVPWTPIPARANQDTLAWIARLISTTVQPNLVRTAALAWMVYSRTLASVQLVILGLTVNMPSIVVLDSPVRMAVDVWTH